MFCLFRLLLTTLPSAQIDLASNALCGVDKNGNGEYSVEGIKAIASAISISASLQRVIVAYMMLTRMRRSK